MASIHLTKRAIEKLAAPTASGNQELVWDTELRGFGVLLSGKTNAKSFIVQRNLPNGKARRVTIGACNTLDLDGADGARARAAKLLVQLRDGIDPRAERQKAALRSITLRQTLDAYLAAKKELRPGTARDYRMSIENYLTTWLDRPLSEIKPDMVERRHAAIQSEVEQRRQAKAKKAGREYVTPPHWQSLAGANMANGVFRVFSLLWNYASDRDDELPANPVRRLKNSWFTEHRRERVIRTDELPKFYEAVVGLENPILRDYVLLLLFTGLRRNEAAELRWEEVDFGAKVIRLGAQRTKAKRKLDLPMSSFVRDLLVQRRAVGNDGGWVFPADSKSGHIEEPGSAFDAIATACGVLVSAHDLRRTFITVAESVDLSPLALKALVNHALGQDVTAGYVQMTAERLREPAQRVCDRIMADCGITAPDAENVVALSG